MKYWLRLLLILAPLASMATCSSPTNEVADQFVGSYAAHVIVRISFGGGVPMIVEDSRQPIIVTRSSRSDRQLVINEGTCLIPANAVVPDGGGGAVLVIQDMTSCHRSDGNGAGRILLSFEGGEGRFTGENALTLDAHGTFSFSGAPDPDGGMPMGDGGGPPPTAGMFTIHIEGNRQ